MNRKRYSGKYTLSRGKRTRMHTRMRKRKQNGGAGQSGQLTSALQQIPPLLAQAEAASKASADALKLTLAEIHPLIEAVQAVETMATGKKVLSQIITWWSKFNTSAIRERSKAIAAIEAAESILHENELLSQKGEFPIEELNQLQIACMKVKSAGEEAIANVDLSERMLVEWHIEHVKAQGRRVEGDARAGTAIGGGGRKKTKNPKKKRSKKKKTKKKKRSKSRH